MIIIKFLLILTSFCNSQKFPRSIKESFLNSVGIYYRKIYTGIPLFIFTKSSFAATKTDDFLYKRSISFDSNQYQPGISSKDVYYPLWFEGKWKTSSNFTSFKYPLDVNFGGSSYNKTLSELYSSLEYISKFKVDQKINEKCISDRLYNVEQISIASLGKNCILSDEQNSNDISNYLNILLRPDKATNTIFNISLRVTDREFYEGANKRFNVFERIEQSIQIQSEFQSRISIKDIETTTSYRKISDNLIQATQRTATFLSPEDPRFKQYYSINPDISQTSVDIRKYDVLFTKINL